MNLNQCTSPVTFIASEVTTEGGIEMRLLLLLLLLLLSSQTFITGRMPGGQRCRYCFYSRGEVLIFRFFAHSG